VLKGVLVAESLPVGVELGGELLRVTRIVRVADGVEAAGQPAAWTLLHFEAAEDDAEALAETLAAALSPTGGWYVDYTTTSEKFVIFAGRIFRYPRGDAAGRAEAVAYGRSVGVPEKQLDWGE
jgi:hypothetical protein